MNTKLYALLLTLACATGGVHASDDKDEINEQGQTGSPGGNQTGSPRLFLVIKDGEFYYEPVNKNRTGQSSQTTSTTGTTNSDQATQQKRDLIEEELKKVLSSGVKASDALRSTVLGTSFGDTAEHGSLSPNQQPTEGKTSNSNSTEDVREVTYRLSRSPRGADSRPANRS